LIETKKLLCQHDVINCLVSILLGLETFGLTMLVWSAKHACSTTQTLLWHWNCWRRCWYRQLLTCRQWQISGSSGILNTFKVFIDQVIF